MELYVAKSSAIAEGKRVLIDHDGNKIGVLRVNGALHAFLNLCPHQGGPACEGMLIHRVEEVLSASVVRALGSRVISSEISRASELRLSFSGDRSHDNIDVALPFNGLVALEAELTVT